MLNPIGQLSEGIANLSAGKKMLSVMEEELQRQDQTTATLDMDAVDRIELQNLNFEYEEKPILSDISLAFEKGKSYAIVGKSGSGKSTLLNCISGVLDDYEGNVLLDGEEISKLNPQNRTKLFSVIQQNVMIFNSTIKDNITMWKRDFEETQIQAAVEKSSLSGLLQEKTIDYNCGENGTNLSGGEKQRISVARAILQESSVILVDEGT